MDPNWLLAIKYRITTLQSTDGKKPITKWAKERMVKSFSEWEIK